MSGASALAAAKRRRSKVDSSRTPSNTSNNSRSNTSTNRNISNSSNSSSSMPPRLNVQQSFQYMWQKILQVESMVNNNTTIMKSNSTVKNSSNNFEVNDLRQKMSILENSVRQLSSNNNSANTVEVNGEKYVSIDQFNDVMNNVAKDMQGVTEKITQLSEFVSNVQNNNVVLRNILDSMQPDNYGFDGSGSMGVSMVSDENNSFIDEGESSVNEDDTSVVNDEDIVEDENENEDVTASPDVSSVLEKLKTLNNKEIKEEVTAELEKNITLVVEESVNISSNDTSS